MAPLTQKQTFKGNDEIKVHKRLFNYICDCRNAVAVSLRTELTIATRGMCAFVCLSVISIHFILSSGLINVFSRWFYDTVSSILEI